MLTFTLFYILFLGRIIFTPFHIIYIFLRASILKLYLVYNFVNIAMSTFYFTWLWVVCMCSSTQVVATRDGNHSLRNLCKMAALEIFYFVTYNVFFLTLDFIFTKNEFWPVVYFKFNIFFVKYILDETAI